VQAVAGQALATTTGAVKFSAAVKLTGRIR
jgi:hypothetical protein